LIISPHLSKAKTSSGIMVMAWLPFGSSPVLLPFWLKRSTFTFMHCCSLSLMSLLYFWLVVPHIDIGTDLDNGKNGLSSSRHTFLVVRIFFYKGILIVVFVLLQHVGGVKALLSESKRDPQHKRFAFWVSNLARIVVVLGWIMKGGDTSNLLYVSIASAILLVGSFYNVYIKKNIAIVNPETK